MPRTVLLLSLLILFSGCSGPRPAVIGDDERGAPQIERALRAEVDDWIGTPYRYGGITRSGIDCSAWVQTVAADLFDVDLPRVTDSQVRIGRKVPSDALRAGDLVFFRPPSGTNHVGIYLSGGEFAHVSTSRGVTISDMRSDYWRAAFWTARRLADRGEIRRLTQVEAISPTPRRPGRAGW